jgi:hypothetical protein
MNYFQLLKELYAIYDKLENKEVNHIQIVRQIKKAVPWAECKIKGIKTLSVTSNQFAVAGLYDPEADEFGDPCIEIEIGFPARKSFFIFSESDLSRDHWSELCIDFSQILGHEYMHMNQFRRRNFQWTRPYRSISKNCTLREKQEYYGDNDEIDAYAFTAAAEILINLIVKRSPKYCLVENSNLYKTYTRIFDKTDPVVLKFVKLTKRYVKKLERQYHDTTF